MRTTLFLVLTFACLASVISTSTDTKNVEVSPQGSWSKWWSPPAESTPKVEEVSPRSAWYLPNFRGAETEQVNPKTLEEAETSLLGKLNTYWPEYAKEDKPEPTLFNRMTDRAANVKNAAKQKAKQEICELIKTCVRGMLWSPFG